MNLYTIDYVQGAAPKEPVDVVSIDLDNAIDHFRATFPGSTIQSITFKKFFTSDNITDEAKAAL